MAKKTILLIIDPQVDFTTGNLKVEGAIEDYKRINSFIDKAPIDEIHVSLDTHNKDHIGHPSFWIEEKHPEKKHPGSFQVLSITNDGKIKATNPNNVETIVTPVDGDIGYAKEYVEYLQNKYNETKLFPMIWDYHCMVPMGQEVNINKTNGFGHAVASPLKEKLESPQIKDKVKYHIKGQNNLTEMYSIFGAEYVSDKAKQIQVCPTAENAIGYNTYDEAINGVDLYVDRNTQLMERLLNGGNNIVYVCGQARTHCVKESLKHLLEYAIEKSYDTTNIRLLYNMSSPISPENGGVDDIHTIPNITLVKTDEEVKNEVNKIRKIRVQERQRMANVKHVGKMKTARANTKGGKRRRKTKKRHNKKTKRKVTKKRHNKKTKKRKVRKTKKNKTRKR